MNRVLTVWLGLMALTLVGCDGSGGTDASTSTVVSPTTSPVVAGDPLVFWSTDVQAERAEAARAILDGFTAQTGIPVQLRLVEEAALSGAMASNAAAGTLPDVVLHSAEWTAEWAEAGYLDLDAARAAIDALGAETFTGGTVGLARLRGRAAAVPVHGWSQVIVYRKDLFDERGLAPPDTFERIETAAAALHDPESEFYGIAAASAPGQVFTQHSFEHFAVANGCELTSSAGTVAIDSPNCVTALEVYTGLLERYGAPAVDGLAEARSRYFGGDAAMLVWSTLILDELAGLRDAALPTCAECAADPGYLARNSGFVGALSGPDGGPAQYGRTVNLGIGAGANADATRLVQYLLSDGYPQWLSIAPENRFPARLGVAEGGTEYLDAWLGASTGVDRVEPLSDAYSADVALALAAGFDELRRWGLVRGESELIAAIYQRLPIPEQIPEVVAGRQTVSDALRLIKRAVEEEQRLLEEG